MQTECLTSGYHTLNNRARIPIGQGAVCKTVSDGFDSHSCLLDSLTLR